MNLTIRIPCLYVTADFFVYANLIHVQEAHLAYRANIKSPVFLTA